MKRFLICVILGAVFMIGCQGQVEDVQEEFNYDVSVGYCKWDGAPSWMVKDMLEAGWGLLDGYGWNHEGNQNWALLIDEPSNGLGGCDYWVVATEMSYDDRYGPGTPLVTVMLTGECETWDQMIEDMHSIDREGGI